MISTEFGSLISFNDTHPLKASVPIDCIPSGNVTLVIFVLPENASSPIPETGYPSSSDGITTSESEPLYPVIPHPQSKME